LYRGVDLAIREVNEIGCRHGDVAAAGMSGLRGYGAIIAQDPSSGVDRDIACIADAGTPGEIVASVRAIRSEAAREIEPPVP
jgi:hypothetical protein